MMLSQLNVIRCVQLFFTSYAKLLMSIQNSLEDTLSNCFLVFHTRAHTQSVLSLTK